MADVKLKGKTVHTNGNLLQVGAKAPDFLLVNKDLQDVKLNQFSGKKKLLYIVPSLDTDTCAISTKKFNDFAKANPDKILLTISADLPFAQKRFCSDQSVENVHTLSMMRNHNFGKDYGILFIDGPLAGILTRAVLVLDEQDRVIHSELVDEVTSEPNYEAALSALA